jgi:hypothetical protein
VDSLKRRTLKLLEEADPEALETLLASFAAADTVDRKHLPTPKQAVAMGEVSMGKARTFLVGMREFLEGELADG